MATRSACAIMTIMDEAFVIMQIGNEQRYAVWDEAIWPDPVLRSTCCESWRM